MVRNASGKPPTPRPEDPTTEPGDEAPPGTIGSGEDLCPVCHGTGKIAESKPCPNCGGTGLIIEGIGGG